jgi:hypothetical protein
METIHRQIGTDYDPRTTERKHASSPLFSSVRLVCKILFPSFAGALLVTSGPAALQTVAEASSVMLHILLELCRVSLFVLQIFGK